MLWWVGWCSCSLCCHSWVGVVEIGSDQSEPIIPLECSHCGNMTGHPTDEFGGLD